MGIQEKLRKFGAQAEMRVVTRISRISCGEKMDEEVGLHGVTS